MQDKSRLQIAREILLEPAGLDAETLVTLLGENAGKNAFSDFFLQSIYSESWHLEEEIVKEGSFGVDQGVGARIVVGEKTGFAYSNEITLATLQQSLQGASAIETAKGRPGIVRCEYASPHNLYQPVNPLLSMSEAEKVELLHAIDSEARSQDKRVKQVSVELGGKYEVVIIVNNEGNIAADVRPLVRLNVSVVVEDNGVYEKARTGGGGRSSYQLFFTDDRALSYAREAVRIALQNLCGAPAPAGSMPVVLGPGWPGVLIHEAVGHGLEGDSIRKGSSVFSSCFGEKVASPLCTIVDNGCLEGERRGSINVDDEGVLTQNTVLIEKGILKGCMQDRLNSSLMNSVSTGNGRRESYAYIPQPRMTNTYMLPGEHEPDEIIVSVHDGIYAVNFSGGEVDVTSGKFVFSTNEAYRIRRGKIAEPIKGATLIGDGATVLQKISMLGNDLQFDEGVGICGKGGQSVPVCVGQPTVKIEELTVGGTFA